MARSRSSAKRGKSAEIESTRTTCPQCSTVYEAPGSCPECGMIFHY